MAGDHKGERAPLARVSVQSQVVKVEGSVADIQRRTVMKWILGVLSVVFLLTCAEFGFASDFEGVVHMKNTFKQRTSEMDWYAKGDKGRMEMQTEDGRKMFWILDGKNRRMIMPMPDGKMYYEMDLSDRDVMEAMPEFDIVRTGKTDTVAGYPCEVVVIKNKKTDKTNSEVCVAKGLGYFMAMGDMGRSGQRTEPPWMKQFREHFKDGGFPLRTIRRNDDGTEDTRMEVTKVEKKRLDDGLFTVPADYKKFDMAEMMKGKGMPGGMQSGKGAGKSGPGPSPGGGEIPTERGDVKMDDLMRGLGDIMKQGEGKK
jgi:hypothetical protein